MDNPISQLTADPLKEHTKPILADPLALEIPDIDLVRIIDQRIEDSQKFFKGKDLYTRRKKNETYVLGRQLRNKEKENKIKPYEARVLDNALYEIEQSLLPIAMGNMPDMIVYDPKTDGESKEAEDITKFVDEMVRKRNIRTALSTAFRHHPVYFTGILKVRWNPEINDMEVLCIHPNKMDIDHTATSNDSNKMNFKTEKLSVTVQDVVMRFPEKKTEFFEELKKHGVLSDETPEWKQMATTITIEETEFIWYEKKELPPEEQEGEYDPATSEPGVKWEKIYGKMWKYEKCLLKKMKDPNFDWEGETKYFIYDDPAMEESKREVTPEEIMESMITGIQLPLVKEQIYKNYFEKPQSAYFFLGYDQWGEMAYDETSRVEQNIYNQENLDTRGKQINDTLSNRGKHIWSKDGGMKASIIERMDMNNPDQDGLVEGDVTRVHKFIAPERPTSQEFEDEANTRTKMFSMAGATNLNGTLQSDTATSNQIAREANFTRIDNLVDETINAACEWIAGWIMQFVKLRYTEDHYTRVMGMLGKQLSLKINSDSVQDGFQVAIKASGADKHRTEQNAKDLAQIDKIDLLSLYQDMDLDDPEGRAEKYLTQITDPVTYLEKYILKVPITPMMPPVDPNAPIDPLAQQAPETVPLGGPQGPTPTDTTQVSTAPPIGVQASPENGVL